MSAQEFGEWQAMFRIEGWHPSAAQWRHAQTLAAAANGPITRKNAPDTMWRATDFAPDPADPWDAMLQPPPLPATPAQINAAVHAHVQQMNAMFDR